MENRRRRKGILKNYKMETEHDISEKATKELIFQPSKAIIDKSKKDRIRFGVRNLYGRHYPVEAKPEYKFMEQWETKSMSFDLNNYREVIQAQTLPAYLYTAIMLLTHIALFWYISVSHFVSFTHIFEIKVALLIGIVTVVIDSSIRFYLEYLRIPRRQAWEWREIILKFKGEEYLLLYYVLNMAIGAEGQNQAIMYLMDGLAAFLIYRRSRELFQLFKIRSYTTSYKHKMKLLDLLGTLLFFLHIFALLLYLVSLSDPQQNWTIKATSPPPQGLERYFYAFYFAATTMLTIGYGDLSPTNKIEILAILPVQILGVAIFSFIISEIGYTVGSVRKQEEQLEHNLSTLSKMEKFYHMEEDVSNIAKHNLVSSQKNSEIVYPEDQQAVLGKLSDQLRDTLQFTNGLDVVKSSLFFLCHWSKHFQAQIAKNLTKKIFHPNELLLQVPGKEKIYIVRNGKMDIYTNCSNNYKQQFKKLLKTIEPHNKPVSDNIYGYTNVISSRNVRLAAVSKEFTSVYYLEKDKFMRCVNETQLDREYFFEMRDKIEQSKCLESFEAPAVLNIRYHYRPNEFFILKSHVQKLRKWSNQRKPCLRNNRIMKLNTNKVATEKIVKTLEQTLHERTEKIINNCKSSEVSYFPKEILVEMFEISREYSNFFRRSNMSCIVAKLELENPKIIKFFDPSQPKYNLESILCLNHNEFDHDN